MNGHNDPSLPAELIRRRDSLCFPLGFGSHPVGEWQAKIRAAWGKAVPLHTDLPQAEFQADRLVDGMRQRPLVMHYADGGVAEGAVLLPDGTGPFPAVLLLHDHGGEFRIGWRKVMPAPHDDLSPLAAAARARHYGGEMPAVVLARAGFAVLALGAFGWGARQACDHDGQQALAANAMQLGTTLAGLVAAEDAAAAEWLAVQDFVDAGRVAAFGFSFGGFRAWQVAALSRAVRAFAAFGWMARRLDLLRGPNPLLRGQSAFWMLHPALTGLADLPDLAGAAAPKPAFFRSGDADPHMPPDAVRPAFADLERIWAALGGRVDAGFFDGGHLCPARQQEAAAAFLLRELA